MDAGTSPNQNSDRLMLTTLTATQKQWKTASKKVLS